MVFPASQAAPQGSSAGNPAPSQHQYGGGQRQAAPPAGGDGGGAADVIDLETFRQQFGPLLEQHTAPLRNQLAAYNQQSQQQSRLLSRLQKVFTADGDEEQQQDPRQRGGGGKKAPKADPRLAQYGESLDHLLGVALKSERAGNPMPVTAQIGSEFYDFAMQQVQQNLELQSQLEEMRAKIDGATNPRRIIWDQAMMDYDNLIRNAVGTIYGGGDEYAEVRDIQWDAISRQILTELKDLGATEPETLDRILRSPQHRRDMVTHFVKNNMPPRARQILEDERLKNTRQTSAELERAWMQARGAIQDPRERGRVQEKIRHQWWEARHEERNPQRGAARAGQRMLHASLYGEGRQPAHRTY
jgi:hypothetical protein